MTGLDENEIHAAIGDATRTRVASLVVFDEVDSTNSYLMRQPVPAPGYLNVAVTDNQTAGRGRHGRTWQSPPGSGLALSVAFTFAESPENLPALTLAIGLGAIQALEDLHIAGVQLKWPNDLIAGDGKLGGILTEALTRDGDAVTIVTGIGLNVDLGPGLDLSAKSGWVQRAVDLTSHAGQLPANEIIVGALTNALFETLTGYGSRGLAPVLRDWQARDWLFGREITVDTAGQQLSGVGAGIADDGALLVETAGQGTVRITSGTVTRAGSGEHVA